MKELRPPVSLGVAPLVHDRARPWLAALLVMPLVLGAGVVAIMAYITFRWPALAADPAWALVPLAVAFVTLCLATRGAHRRGAEGKTWWTALAIACALLGALLPMLCWAPLLGG